MKKNTSVDTTVGWLLTLGGLVWGLEGVGTLLGRQFNPVTIFIAPGLETYIYVAIGLAAVYDLYKRFA